MLRESDTLRVRTPSGLGAFPAMLGLEWALEVWAASCYDPSALIPWSSNDDETSFWTDRFVRIADGRRRAAGPSCRGGRVRPEQGSSPSGSAEEVELYESTREHRAHSPEQGWHV